MRFVASIEASPAPGGPVSLGRFSGPQAIHTATGRLGPRRCKTVGSVLFAIGNPAARRGASALLGKASLRSTSMEYRGARQLGYSVLCFGFAVRCLSACDIVWVLRTRPCYTVSHESYHSYSRLLETSAYTVLHYTRIRVYLYIYTQYSIIRINH